MYDYLYGSLISARGNLTKSFQCRNLITRRFILMKSHVAKQTRIYLVADVTIRERRRLSASPIFFNFHYAIIATSTNTSRLPLVIYALVLDGTGFPEAA